jgi:murein L,D-transpeptidase YcbB/YkuD
VRQTAMLVLLLASVLTGAQRAEGQDSVAAAVRLIVRTGRLPWARWPDFARYRDVVNRLYEAEPDSSIWLDHTVISTRASAAIAALLAAGEHGLDPRDYDAETLDRVARHSVGAPLNPVDRARFDLLLSVDLLRLLDDLRSGRLHPGTFDREESRSLSPNFADAVRGALAADSLPQLLAGVAPQLAQYRKLQRLLSRYRAMAADSSLSPVPNTPPVRPGRDYPGLLPLRRRLAAMGDLPADSAFGPGEVYGEADADAVRRFQRRHGLKANGVLDSATVAEINTPFQQRARQIELALERLRWLPPIRGQRFLVVNIPGFQLFAFDSAGGSGVPSLGMRVIVGKALDTRTPVLLEQLRYLEFRPYWNVPRSIVVDEIVPLVQRNPRYLQENDMELVGPGDRVVDSLLSFELLDQLNRGELWVRQRPGPRNALGLVKFVFPNSAAVYLHGTPRTELFTRTRRDFSHGCIRVEDPTALAAWVLRDQPRWSRQEIIAAQMGRRTTRAWVTSPMPVIVFYTTAVAAPDGGAWFYADIYGHDRELDEALRAGPISP